MGKICQLYQTVIVLIWLCFAYTIAQKMGPFKVNINNVVVCGPNSGGYWVLDLKIKKYNRTVFALDGSAMVNRDFDDSVRVKVVLAQFTNNGWKENYFEQDFKSNGCSTIRTFATDIYDNLMVNIGAKQKCPLKKGNYTLHNFPLTIHINQVPVFFYNKYRANLKFYDKGRAFFCVEGIVDVVPKKP